jgi:hypothetical protein
LAWRAPQRGKYRTNKKEKGWAMSPPERLPLEKAEQPKMQMSRRVAIKSIVAAATVVCGAVGSVRFAGSFGLWPPRQGDDISDAERQRRIDAFAALGALSLSIVADDDRARAVQSMNLPPSARESLLGPVTGQALATNEDSVTMTASAAAATSSAAQVQTSQRQQVSEPTPSQSSHSSDSGNRPAMQSLAQRQKLARLAWMTLWDSNVEDGDAVRVECGGYARTVTLTKRGITFAVPVPPDGQIRLIGVRDGDGGGITVGLASGSANVLLPIMSVGEVLNLNVKVS